MQPNFGIHEMLNAAGALLFLVEGIVILVVARGSRRGQLVGGLAASFGLVYVLQNLFDNRDEVATWILVACAVPTTALALLLARDLASGVDWHARRELVLLGAAFAALVGFATAAVALTPEFPPALGFAAGTVGVVFIATFVGLYASLVVLLAACVQRFHRSPREAVGERRALASLGLAFGLYAMFYIASIPAGYLAGVGWNLVAIAIAAQMLPVVVVSASWVVRRSGNEPRLAFWIFLALTSVGVAGGAIRLVPGFDTTSFGSYGIVRTLGALLLAVAVVRYDLLGVPLPKVVVRRGVLAGGALAVLFIVAQVAQNFFAAEYGLIMGGVVAGAVVFAASPIQRAMERAGKMDGTARPRKTQEDAYKSAVRLALRGGITHREAMHLARIAEACGIGPVRAVELRREIESEPEVT